MNDNLYESYEKFTLHLFSFNYPDYDPCHFDDNIDNDITLYNYI